MTGKSQVIGALGLAPVAVGRGESKVARRQAKTGESHPVGGGGDHDLLRDRARRDFDRARSDRIAVLHELMAALHGAIEYREGETHVHSTASEVLLDGKGVCQDQAHAFIACARAIDIPARYVSGYLYTGEQEQASVASHAWAAAWVDHLGWIGFDVTNRVCATERHVGLAQALDYAGASPVRGVRQGGSLAELMEVQVRVAQA